MYSIEVVLAMLAAVVGSGYLVRTLPISIPLPLAQIALGAVVALVSVHRVRLDPEIFFLLFLPPLLFLDGWRIDDMASDYKCDRLAVEAAIAFELKARAT